MDSIRARAVWLGGPSACHAQTRIAHAAKGIQYFLPYLPGSFPSARCVRRWSPLAFLGRLDHVPYPPAIVVPMPLLAMATSSILTKGVHGREPHAAARGGVAGGQSCKHQNDCHQ